MKRLENLDEWNLFSERRNSKNYMSEDGKWLLKLSTGMMNASVEDIVKEKEIIDKAIELGIVTPTIKEIVEYEDCYGAIYEYLEGKKSISRAISEDPDNIKTYCEAFARMAKKFHATKCDTSYFRNAEDVISERVKHLDYLSDEQKQKIFKKMEETEKMTICLHSDFQPSNFVIGKNKKEYVIDIADMVYGNPLYDLGVCYFFLMLVPGEIKVKILHLDEEMGAKCWKLFLMDYFGVKTDEEIKKLNEMIAPYSMIGIYLLISRIGTKSTAKDAFPSIVIKNIDRLL